MPIGSLAELNRYKDVFRDLCTRTQACSEALGCLLYGYDYVSREGLGHLEGKLVQANFKVIVIGKFSTGKSSLINALLGEQVLPDSLSPCTAYINEVVYGEEEQATIYFKQPLPADWEKFVQNEAVKKHILKHGQKNVPELELPLEELGDCVTIPWDDDDIFGATSELDISPFAKAVIHYPCELCRNGIEIIDSPGLDEARDRTEIVDKYLKRVDAVIYVMTNIATGGDSDKELIRKYLVDNDIKNVFFVCNLFGIPLKMAQKQLLGRLRKVFGDKTILGEKGIHLVNIRDPRNTGIAEFEAALSTYLNEEKGRAQLQSYKEQLTKLNLAVEVGISGFDCVHDVKLRQVEQELTVLHALLERERELVQESRALRDSIRESVNAFCRTEVMERLKKLSYAIRTDIKDRNDVGAMLSGTATQAEARVLAQSLAQEYAQRMEQDVSQYLNEELTVDLAREIRELLTGLQKRVDNFASTMAEEDLQRSKLQGLALTEILSRGFKETLVIDNSDKLSYAALKLEGLLDDAVSKVFAFCAGFQNANRGANLTAELQNQVTVDVFKKLEHAKRNVTEYVIQQALDALEQLLFAPVKEGMEAELALEQQRLAAKEGLRLEVMAKRKQEHAGVTHIQAELNKILTEIEGLANEMEVG